mmetsp:Transcript_65819/g.162019  ORF Transcript_65819/g.162019 Transcript_65819/m.162019 type:complete len:218 (+) Transcript_65819:343-996(+)
MPSGTITRNRYLVTQCPKGLTGTVAFDDFAGQRPLMGHLVGEIEQSSKLGSIWGHVMSCAIAATAARSASCHDFRVSPAPVLLRTAPSVSGCKALPKAPSTAQPITVAETRAQASSGGHVASCAIAAAAAISASSVCVSPPVLLRTAGPSVPDSPRLPKAPSTQTALAIAVAETRAPASSCPHVVVLQPLLGFDLCLPLPLLLCDLVQLCRSLGFLP